MDRYNRQQPMHSNPHQQAARAEIARQIEEFMARGGKIEQLHGPCFQASRNVGINSPALVDVL